MEDKKTINIAFAATANMLPYAVVTALSVKDKLKPDYNLNVYFLWTESSLSTKEEFINYKEYADFTLNQYNINIEYIDVTGYMKLFQGQNIGQWGEEISYTHYMYLLLPKVVSNIDKVIYLDTDMVVNYDLAEVYERDLENYLLAMGAPRGHEDMGEDVSNSGFVVINTVLWRKEGTFETLMDFGKNLEKSDFCDQNLLHEYFAKQHPDRLVLYEKELNIFPQLFPNLKFNDMKILHYTGENHCKPYDDIEAKSRGCQLWWYYARKTSFYEMFYTKAVEAKIKNCVKNTFIENFNKQFEKAVELFPFKEKLYIIWEKMMYRHKNKFLFNKILRVVKLLKIIYIN